MARPTGFWYWARVRGEEGGLAEPWRWGTLALRVGAGTHKALLVMSPKVAQGRLGPWHRVVPFPEARPSQPVSETDVSTGRENHASCLHPKLPPGGGRTPGAHFNSPSVISRTVLLFLFRVLLLLLLMV